MRSRHDETEAEEGAALDGAPSWWRRWAVRPQQLWLRRALFQIHLWGALLLGIYVVLISVSGSAVVFRRELNLWLVPRAVPAMIGERLTGDALRAAVRRAYPADEIAAVNELKRPQQPVYVSLRRQDKLVERLFDPYRAADMGSAYPPTLQLVEWLVEVHDNLLLDQTGRLLNGVGGAAVLLVVLSGAVLWWPGRRRWRASLIVGRPAKTRRFAWQLHSAIGFWSFALLFIWALTAVYFAFPDPVERALDYFDPNPNDAERPGEWIVLLLVKAHFGRFGGLEWRVLWTLLGLLPVVLFVTGFILWWTRVVRRRWMVRRHTGAVEAAIEEFRGRDADRAA